ncbi:uncharacterized protein LOC117286367 [Fukomys damarensis]|uniref:uncharacterized protein LOC117286367 n=1 Tax=Fukomys damarensis TaxID=885580 RepID=UPI0014559BB5|nr:uncharacterized protein LOC117286367 [Fukomys damarensis]XP_033620514.1 uncharacterized protein LOC117286367 [Fukomys damarensis]XP_033620515.1 uncharacterized protein LOC117286367 [Fukomys damarensis]
MERGAFPGIHILFPQKRESCIKLQKLSAPRTSQDLRILQRYPSTFEPNQDATGVMGEGSSSPSRSRAAWAGDPLASPTSGTKMMLSRGWVINRKPEQPQGAPDRQESGGWGWRFQRCRCDRRRLPGCGGRRAGAGGTRREIRILRITTAGTHTFQKASRTSWKILARTFFLFHQNICVGVEDFQFQGLLPILIPTLPQSTQNTRSYNLPMVAMGLYWVQPGCYGDHAISHSFMIFWTLECQLQKTSPSFLGAS